MSIDVNIRQSAIDVNIRQSAINVSINRIGGSGKRTITGITITTGEATVINTNQSSVRPVFIELWNESGKRIDKNMPEPVVSLSTNYLITYPSQLIGYDNVTLYYL